MPHFCLDDSPHFRMIELDEVSSTNSFLRDYRPIRPTDITLVTAEYQTAGRGQATNRWESERSKNLLFSILAHPQALPVSHIFLLSEAIALAIREAITPPLTGGSREGAITVKWPNDIYVGDCKIAGILIENEFKGTSLDRCIIGCGVDINQEHFHFPTPPTPCSLYQLLGHDTERRFVLEDIMESFLRRYAQLQAGHYDDIQREYHAALYRRDGLHNFADETGVFRASIHHVEPSGHLVLCDSEGRERRYAFKEVAFQR
ncbi:MAG: biotin--[Bacteroidaceae bacterium]|nr:biotin--[acetyl-CoA-carboxylase] ligase [Bacteroidaceae bacterium]